jgi:Relaxase/Mobilisation nuclease domain
MIAKGTTHDSGGRLATYMITGKDGEKAELWQVRGFAGEDIKDAFRSVHILAEATRCQQPLFHVQVRNPEGEHLTREQWERVADRIESKLGLSDQPRAIAFHRQEATGDEHMHIGWSRIDEATWTAKALPFFKLRLKEVSRELEAELGLTPVRNEREGPVMAPRRYEDEQARRLGVEIHDVRDTIRECWKHSDNGRSFSAALSEQGLTLAKGDKRDFIAIDNEGGMHALGKRILGNTAAEIRTRCVDLDRDQMPTVEQAREQLAAKREAAPQPTVTHARELATEIDFSGAAKENAGRAVEPETPAPPQQVKREPELSESAVEIGRLYRSSINAAGFTAALDREGIRLAAVTASEAKQSGTYREGQIVAVTARGEVCPLDEHTVGADRSQLDAFLASVDRRELSGIEETQKQTDAEIRLHIQLSQVGVLHPPEPAPAPEATPEPVDWEKLLTDSAYREEIRRQQNEERQKVRTHDLGRSPERER